MNPATWARPRSPRLERSLERRIFEIVLADPAHAGVFVRQLRRRKIEDLLNRGLWACILPGAVIMPVAFAALFLGFGAFFGAPAKPPNPPQLALAWQSLAFAGLVLIGADDFRRRVFAADDLRIFSHLPLSDADLLRRCVSSDQWLSAIVYVVFAASTYGYLVWHHQPTVIGWTAAATVAAIQWWMIGGLAECLGRWTQARGFALAGGGLCLIAFFGAMSSFLLERQADAIAWPLFLLTPMGWVNGAFYHDVLRGAWWGWLLLAPAGVVLAMLGRWRHATYAIREFEFVASDQLQAVLEPGYATPPKRPLSRRAQYRRSSEAPRQVFDNVVERSAEEIETVIRAGGFLADVDEKQRNPLTPICTFWIGRRFLAVLSLTCPELPWWSRLWAIGAVQTVVVIPLSLIAWQAPAAMQWSALSLVVLMGFFAEAVSSADTTAARRQPRAWSLYPVTFRELTVASFRLNLLRCMLQLPVAAALAGVVAFGSGAPVADGLAYVLAPMYLFMVAGLYGVCLTVAGISNDTTRHRWLLAVWGIAGTPLMIGGMAFLMNPGTLGGQLSAAAFTIGAVGLWLLYDWLYRTGRIDLVSARR